MGGMTPELPKIADEIYEAAARAWAANSMAAVHGDWSARDQWPARLQDNENLHRIVDTVWPVAYQAGREDAARELKIDEIRRAARRICARIVASSHLLDVPFTDAPDQSPWTKAKRDMAALYAAVGININLGRSSRGVGDNTEEQQQEDGRG